MEPVAELVSVYMFLGLHVFFYVFFSLDVVSPGFHTCRQLNMYVPNG